MRIVIDMQGAQSSGSADRGIGRYSLSLAEAIVSNRGSHEIFLALNGLFSDSILKIRSVFDNLLPQENIRIWTAPEPLNQSDHTNDWRRHSAELLREAFLASLNPDIVLVTSLFEGLHDNAVSSIGKLSNAVPTAVILYDLIPLIYGQKYLENPIVKLWYEEKISHLRRANILLAISESSRCEGIDLLDFSSETSFNISSAICKRFQPQKINKKQEKDIRERFGLFKPFVLYTGGIDYRKNQEGLIRAYASLPGALRSDHQLAIVCSMQTSDRTALEILAKEKGLGPHELVLTGFISDEDLLSLYNLCKMFVFPSWHEGFGLPVLEAMACGCAVIGANTSSLPEVIGRDDALFDPKSDTSIAKKMEQVLNDNTYRLKLKQHGLQQAKRFSWDATAQRAIFACETLHTKKINEKPLVSKPSRRLKLAYISPLPPERSGISGYSSELLPALSRHYKIDVIIAQDFVSDPWIKANCSVHNVDWFRKHVKNYDRVLYQFGNSQFHMHMLNLLEEVPGAIVLHDFFLSGMIVHIDVHGYDPGLWSRTLYYGHGYAAMQKRFHTLDSGEVIIQYPCSHEVISGAQGVIVHSEYSRQLSNNWYGNGSADDWSVIPLLRTVENSYNKDKARNQLKLCDTDFVVCSFGFLGPTKMSHRLLDSWLKSDLAQNPNCKLVFVGENNNGEYGIALQNKIRESGLYKRILITGWTDDSLYRNYLAAADLAVQLRTLSRGETSGAVLDCLNYSLPTIVNANGSMAELQNDTVWKLPDEFNDGELTNALEVLWKKPAQRKKLGARASEIIRSNHDPLRCADLYAQAIEKIYSASNVDIQALINAVISIASPPADTKKWAPLANAIAQSIPRKYKHRQLLVDISELVQLDLIADTHLEIISNLKALLMRPPTGFRVEPIYMDDEHTEYRYARKFTLKILQCPEDELADEIVEYYSGDLFIGCNEENDPKLDDLDLYKWLSNLGVRVKISNLGSYLKKVEI